MTPRISLVAVCCSAAWRSSRACEAIVFSCAAINFSCLAIVFFSCERDSTRDAVRITFDFFERFLGVVAIKKRNGETVAGETKDVAGAVYTVVTSSPGG
jgi:hypothetical protein